MSNNDCDCGGQECRKCNPNPKKKKSPLEGIKDYIESMTPEERKAWQDNLAESMKKHREEREKEAERKRNEPPKTPTGHCMICGGLVKGEFQRRWRDTGRIGGPPSPGYWHFLGYHCVQCGLVYKFPPSSDVVMTYGHVKP